MKILKVHIRTPERIYIKEKSVPDDYTNEKCQEEANEIFNNLCTYSYKLVDEEIEKMECEFEELNKRWKSLIELINENKDMKRKERSLAERQCKAMDEYITVLAERIGLAKGVAPWNLRKRRL